MSGETPPDAARARLAALVDSLGLEPSPPSPCPYLPGRASRLVAIRPDALEPRLYRLFLDLNFRRLGPVVYRPACEGCRECRQLRVDVRRFRPNRAQRRCLKRNPDVVARTGPPEATEEKHELYRRYLLARHDGAMSGSWEEFQGFLHEAPPFAREVVFRAGDRLVGAGIYDAGQGRPVGGLLLLRPRSRRRAPPARSTCSGSWRSAGGRGVPWLYLGYHVAGSPTMAYKAGYGPHQILGDDGEWR